MADLGGQASMEIDAPIDALWEIVGDVEGSPSWQAGLDALTVLERDDAGRVLRAETVSDAKVRTVKSVVRFSYDEPRGLSWRQEKGDLKRMDGEWRLEDLGGGRTRVTYTLEADPGRMLGMLVRGPVEERLREMLVGGRPAELAARAGAG